MKPTLAERCVFGEGDGTHLKVVDTEIGRLGALNCREHLQPLLKYAMYAQNEQIHIASWPALALYKEQSYAPGKEATWAVSQTYALEGQCDVLASTMNATPDVVEMLCNPAGHYARPDVARLLLNTAPARRVVLMDNGGSPGSDGEGADECEACESCGAPLEPLAASE